MVIRLVAVPDQMELADFDDVFHAMLGWEGGIGYAFQVHGQEFNSFRRQVRSKRLRDFGLHRQEKFLYTLGALDQWEWELRVVDLQEGATGDETPGGEDVRRVQEYLQPGSEHWIDWFHITMRVTVLQQQTKTLMAEAGRAETGAAIAKRIDSAKHLIWHGNVAEALDRLHDLLQDLDLIRDHSAAAEKLARGMTEFEVYIRNNQEFIPNFGERYRQGETITTAFVESTINQVVSRRFVKKQQMAWTLRGAHLLLQTRTKVLNNELENVFRRWYPQFRTQQKAA
jgi:Plasmid pRiA4b ORF-3-like protein